MPTVLITGANKGVGFATARRLAQLGARVWMGARSPERGRAAAAALRGEGLDARFVHLDVTDLGSIRSAADEIDRACGVLDILINNAGIMNESVPGTPRAQAPSAIALETLRSNFETNFIGPIAVIQVMLPLLRKADAARIVNVSSRLGSFGHQTDPAWAPRAVNQLAYSSAKAALNMATVMFAYELRATRIKVNAATPGTVATDLNGRGAAGLAGQPGYASAESGAQIIVRCALLGEDGPTGAFFGPTGVVPW